MQYFVKNKSGNVSDVTEKIYNQRLRNKEYECWKEDPYAAMPVEVEKSLASSEFTVAQVKEMIKDMSPEEIKEFLEGDKRKTIKALL